jgi:hypothetical protein
LGNQLENLKRTTKKVFSFFKKYRLKSTAFDLIKAISLSRWTNAQSTCTETCGAHVIRRTRFMVAQLSHLKFNPSKHF